MICSFNEIVPKIAPDAYVADSANVIGDVILHKQVSIWFGAVLRGDIEPIEIGEGSNLQDLSVAHTSHDFPVRIGRYVTVGHQVCLHGCTVGDHCLIGMKATLLDGAIVGDNCLIGAGALVKQGQVIPPGSLAVGAPARIIRQLDEEQMDAIRANTRRYIVLRQTYLDGGSTPL